MLQDGSRAIVADPGEAKPVFDALASNRLQLAAILVTHHHDDHTGGVVALREATGAQIAIGRRINPCLRSREATVFAVVCEHAGLAAQASETEAFAALRQWKNDF